MLNKMTLIWVVTEIVFCVCLVMENRSRGFAFAVGKAQ